MLTLMIIVFFGCMLIGVPMAYSAGLATISYVLTSGIPLTVLAQQMFVSADNFSMIAIPLFILAGDFMNNGGITKAIMHFARALVGHIRGSLAHVTILANMMFAAMSGSANAACAVMGSMMIPEMKDEGYDDGFACAVTDSSSILGPIIPPSIIFVLYGSITGTPVSSLLVAGIVPGVLIGLFFMIAAYLFARVHKYPTSAHVSWKERLSAFVHAIPALMAPLIIVGGILSGIFTATEAGVVLCLYCGLLSILYKEMTLKSFYNLLADTMESSATILFLIAASSIMSYVMSYSGIPAAISNALMSVSSNRYVILLIMNVFLLVMGMFLDLTPAVLIFTPIFLPITRSIGMSDVQFGIMLIMNLGIGSVTPPVGSCLFVGCGVGKVKIEGVTKYIVPLFAAMVVALFLVTFIPAIALVVPYLCGLVPSLGWTM